MDINHHICVDTDIKKRNSEQIKILTKKNSTGISQSEQANEEKKAYSLKIFILKSISASKVRFKISNLWALRE
jgi:hypothetical protein